MKNTSQILANHKKLVIDANSNKLHHSGRRSSDQKQRFNQKRSSSFNIHKTPSKGKKQGQILEPCRPQHRVSESSQNYLKLKIENLHDPQIKLNRLSQQRSFFDHDNSKENLLPKNQDSPSRNQTFLIHSIEEIIEHFKEQNELTLHGKEDYIVNKQKFKEIILQIIQWIIKSHKKRKLPKCSCHQLSCLLNRLTDEVEKELRETCRERLELERNVINTNVTLNEQSLESSKMEVKIHKLSAQSHSLEQQINNLVVYEKNIKQQCTFNQNLMEKEKKQCEELHLEAQREQEHLRAIKISICKAEQQYSSLLKSSQSIKNFSQSQQNNKMLKIISQDYKEIESSIYEYAVYLQSNQLASELEYEPHPFRQIQQTIEKAQKQLNEDIMTNEQHTLQEKCASMRTFVNSSISKFKKKDQEMSKVLEFRTKCIRKFIDHMKKWLSNWQLKQQFLVNLRKEFAADSTILMQKLSKSECIDQEQKIAKNMAERMIQNYMMGNSFY